MREKEYVYMSYHKLPDDEGLMPLIYSKHKRGPVWIREMEKYHHFVADY
jgi:hypothetical protein